MGLSHDSEGASTPEEAGKVQIGGIFHATSEGWEYERYIDGKPSGIREKVRFEEPPKPQ